MGDDYFFTSPPSRPVPPPQGGQPAAGYGGPQQPLAPGGFPAGAPGPGMPGYSWHVHQQVQAEVAAAAPPAVPMSAATVVAAVAGLGSMLMLIGSWAPWVTIRFSTLSETGGGLRSGLDGRYVLAVGIAALLAAGTAVTTGQTNIQIRQICAGALVALGVTGLVIVVHDWGNISAHVRALNGFIDAFRSLAASDPNSAGADSFTAAFDGLHVTRDWGIWLSGIASALTGLAGGYLFIVK